MALSGFVWINYDYQKQKLYPLFISVQKNEEELRKSWIIHQLGKSDTMIQKEKKTMKNRTCVTVCYSPTGLTFVRNSRKRGLR
jgi:hypothetical protein